jgi:nitrous oxide reductase accessory protein NosL
MKRIIALLVLAVVLLAGCATPEPTATPVPTHTPQPTLTPTPTPTTGQVKGALVDKSTGQAVAAKVNLVPVEVRDDGSIAYSTELLKERAMIVDAPSGVFLFEDAKPGHYLITVNIGGGLPRDLVDDQGAVLLVRVEAGQVVDLGEVTVEK